MSRGARVLNNANARSMAVKVAFPVRMDRQVENGAQAQFEIIARRTQD
jgi:hypothetical protein